MQFLSLLNAVAAQAESLQSQYASAGGFGLAAVLTVALVAMFKLRESEREKKEVAHAAALAKKDDEMKALRDAKDKEIAELNKAMVAMVERQTVVLVEATGIFKRAEEVWRDIAQTHGG